MKKDKCSCGFIIAEVKFGFPSGWLMAHPTNAGDRWDFPKGMAEDGEDHLEAAKRELFEETGLRLPPNAHIINLGQHPYAPKKDLHLFYTELANINTYVMHCESMVENPKGSNFPEMDAFHVFDIDKVARKANEKMDAWIRAYVPEDLRIGYGRLDCNCK